MRLSRNFFTGELSLATYWKERIALFSLQRESTACIIPELSGGQPWRFTEETGGSQSGDIERMKTVVILCIAALSAAIGDVFLSHGMRSSGAASAETPAKILGHLTIVVRNPYVGTGVIFMGIFFYLYLASLSWADLSFAKPITSLSFLFAAVFAALILREDVPWYRWIGTALIVIGVAFVSLGQKPSGTEAEGRVEPNMLETGK